MTILGDVVGVLLNIPEKYVRFSLNGIPLYQKHKEFLCKKILALLFNSFLECSCIYFLPMLV